MSNDLLLFLGVSSAHALAVSSPGPDFAVIVRHTLTYGKRTGIWLAAGIGSGIIVHVAYGLFGLSWLLERVPQALTYIAILGGVFLIYLGIQGLRAKPHAGHSDSQEYSAAPSAKKGFWVGFITNVLNPKATLFFVALFSAVATQGASPLLKLALAIWLPVTTFAWFCLVAVLLGQAKLRNRLLRKSHWIDRAMGVILIALGIYTLANPL